MAALALRLVDPDNVIAACRMALKPGQDEFVAPVAFSLAEAYVYPDIAWPRVVYDGDDLVGFLMAEMPDENGDFSLWRLNIAGEHQGKGYGRFAVEEVAREVVRRGGTRLYTSYVPGEGGPEGFYLRLGFVPTGEMDDDEVIVALDLPPGDGDG